MNIKRQDCIYTKSVYPASSIWIGRMMRRKKIEFAVGQSEWERQNKYKNGKSITIHRRKKMRRDEEKSWSRKCILLTLQLSLSIYLSFFFLFVIYLSRNNFFLSKEIFRLSVKDLKQRLYLTALNTECLSWEDIPSEQQRIFLWI